MEIPQRRSPGHEREMVFCHECENEWYRDEHGLTCPECHSDFTEIIEEANDPRADLLLADDESDDPHDGRPSNSSRVSPNPWASVPDPDEGNINELHWQSTGPGRYTLHGTIYGNVGGRGAGANQNQNNNAQDGMATNFMTMLQNIVGAHRMGGMNQPEQTQTQTQDRPGHIRVIQGGGPGHSFTYTSTARLLPRDANNPQRMEPLDDLNAILATMFGPPILQSVQHDGQQQQHPPPLNPLAALLGSLIAPGGIHGDAVYSQEALDRVISRLMEQNASGNAPGPAATEDIASLPKRKITIEDLGTDGKAECSICMDEVEVGDEVTVLPCTHWFHGQCVGMWLGEHDTCPHCRKGISNHSNTSSTGASSNSGTNNRNQPGVNNSAAAAASTPNINTANTGSPNAALRSPSAQPPYPSPWASPAQQQPPAHSYPPSPAPPRPFPFANAIYNPVSPFDSSPSSSATGSAFGSSHPNMDAQTRQRSPHPYSYQPPQYQQQQQQQQYQQQQQQQQQQGERRSTDGGDGSSGGGTIAERIRRGLFGPGPGSRS